jgi:hypothetical protein
MRIREILTEADAFEPLSHRDILLHHGDDDLHFHTAAGRGRLTARRIIRDLMSRRGEFPNPYRDPEGFIAAIEPVARRDGIPLPPPQATPLETAQAYSGALNIHMESFRTAQEADEVADLLPRIVDGQQEDPRTEYLRFPAGTHLDRLIALIVRAVDGTSGWDEYEEQYGYYDKDDDNEYQGFLDFVRGEVEAKVTTLLNSQIYRSPVLTLHRRIRTSEDVVAQLRQDPPREIGSCWTYNFDHDTAFLDQYGEDDGIDWCFTAQARHTDVDWLTTLIQHCNPNTANEEEIFLPAGTRVVLLGLAKYTVEVDLGPLKGRSFAV